MHGLLARGWGSGTNAVNLLLLVYQIESFGYFAVSGMYRPWLKGIIQLPICMMMFEVSCYKTDEVSIDVCSPVFLVR